MIAFVVQGGTSMEKGRNRGSSTTFCARGGLALGVCLSFLLDAFIPCRQTEPKFLGKKVPGMGVRIKG
jgi:hypothetical protein